MLTIHFIASNIIKCKMLMLEIWTSNSARFNLKTKWRPHEAKVLERLSPRFWFSVISWLEAFAENFEKQLRANLCLGFVSTSIKNIQLFGSNERKDASKLELESAFEKNNCVKLRFLCFFFSLTYSILLNLNFDDIEWWNGMNCTNR